MNIYTQCSGYASYMCPCELAEKGMCIVCSLCRGEEMCSCTDTVSYCIMQELLHNNGHAKAGAPTLKCRVISTAEYDNDIRMIRVKLPEACAAEYQTMGAYVFLRTCDRIFYDCPVSVLCEENSTDDVLSFLVHINGIKTECFRNIKAGEDIFVRGPYFNSIQGKRQAANLRDSNAVVIARGMGIIAALYLIRMLRKQGNSVRIYFEMGHFSQELFELICRNNDIFPEKTAICDQNGELTDELKALVDKCCRDETELVHLGMSNYPMKKIIEYIKEEHGCQQKISCNNNTNICCGEGICGACTKRINEGRTVHLCKEQMDVYEFAELL